MEVVGSLIGISVLVIVLLCCRRHMRGQDVAHLVRPDHRTGYEDFMEVISTSTTPAWVNVAPSPVCIRDDQGWDRDSVGEYLTVVTSRTLKVTCPYNLHGGVEGATWNLGFTTGRHVFAVMWPREERVYWEAGVTVGVGIAGFDMHAEYGQVLIGGNRKSVGFNLVSKTLWYNGCKVMKYPKEKTVDFCVPTLFYMYLDLEENKLSFGSEDEFYGVALNLAELRKGELSHIPLQPMAAFRKVRGKFMMFYKGTVPEERILRPPPRSPGYLRTETTSSLTMSASTDRLSSIPEEFELSFNFSSRQQLCPPPNREDWF